MARIDNLDQGALRNALRPVRQAATATPGNNMSIGRNGLRVHDGGHIIIENNGGITITGPDGELIGTGTLTWVGQTNLEGPVSLTGDLTVEGTVPMVIGVTSNGRPGVEFAGGRMSSDGSRIALESGSSTVGAAGTFASISAGSYAILAKTDGAYILNLPTTTNAPNLYVDSATGKLYRSVGGV